MFPEFDGDLYINGERAVRIHPSMGRCGSRWDGYVLWTWDYRPLGWVATTYLAQIVVAAKLFEGELTPVWEPTNVGARALHPRFTFEVERTPSGWLVRVTDEITGRRHSLKPKPTEDEAKAAAGELYGRLVGHAMPPAKLCKPPSGLDLTNRQDYPLVLALAALRDDVAGLVRAGSVDTRRSLRFVDDLARFLDECYTLGLDPVPLLGTRVATYIKAALLELYRGASSMALDPTMAAVQFTQGELRAFRERFRRQPMMDNEYLKFVDRYLLRELRLSRRNDRTRRYPGSPIADKKSYQPRLRPRKDWGDFPMRWPVDPGTRMFQPLLLDRYRIGRYGWARPRHPDSSAAR
jgi:hypothetical protein